MTAKWQDPEVRNTEMLGEQCSLWVGSFLFEPHQCEHPSTHIVHAGCVHEHVFSYHVCERHASIAETLYCNQCTDSAESHECPLTVTVAELVAS